jgi:hypothetical protein
VTYDETIRGMIADANREREVKVKVARALAKLPDDYSRRKALRAAAIMLDCPEAVGDRPNR